MSSTTPTMEQLSERLNRLEKQNRRLRGAVIGLALGIAVVFLAGGQQAGPQPVESDHLILRDANGKARGMWAMGDGGPELRFLHANGDNQATLGTTANGFTIRLFDPRKRLQTGLALQPEGVAVVHYERDGSVQTGRNALLLSTGIFPPK